MKREEIKQTNSNEKKEKKKKSKVIYIFSNIIVVIVNVTYICINFCSCLKVINNDYCDLLMLNMKWNVEVHVI